MPQATLTFTLPEEQVEFMQAANAGEIAAIIHEIDQRLRGILKYGEPSEETARLAEEIRQRLGEYFDKV